MANPDAAAHRTMETLIAENQQLREASDKALRRARLAEDAAVELGNTIAAQQQDVMGLRSEVNRLRMQLGEGYYEDDSQQIYDEHKMDDRQQIDVDKGSREGRSPRVHGGSDEYTDDSHQRRHPHDRSDPEVHHSSQAYTSGFQQYGSEAHNHGGSIGNPHEGGYSPQYDDLYQRGGSLEYGSSYGYRGPYERGGSHKSVNNPCL